MIMPEVAYESSAGGPFMRDINTQSGDDQELYVYWNSGHVRTEPWRFGLNGPYAMRFTLVFPTPTGKVLMIDTDGDMQYRREA